MDSRSTKLAGWRPAAKGRGRAAAPKADAEGEKPKRGRKKAAATSDEA